MTTPTVPPRPPHGVLAGILCLLAALAVGPLVGGAGPTAGATAGAPDHDDTGSIHVELSAAGVVAGGHGTAAPLALPAPASPPAGHASAPPLEPAVPPRVLTRPFDRVSYRTTGPPLRVA